ncbi:MAG: helix-turn-helix domain-containing protein [Spirosomaceae bacterium]|nr:helix-turn-helix domain-containing protein [Spirosomataceae bacterium]
MAVGTLFPYSAHRRLWWYLGIFGIYMQWLLYILLSFPYVKDIFKTAFNNHGGLRNIDFWVLSVYTGVSVIWLAHLIAPYTSYIVGALSFSFVIYLMVLLLIFRRNKTSNFFEEKIKYEGKKLDTETLLAIEQKLSWITERELFLNSQLTLSETAKVLEVQPHILSQVLNEKYHKSFSAYINELRIERAKILLHTKHNLTVEGIGFESGFNSKSSFFTVFKKMTGQTPAEYQKKQGL